MRKYIAANYSGGKVTHTAQFEAANNEEAVVVATTKLGFFKNSMTQEGTKVAVVGVKAA